MRFLQGAFALLAVLGILAVVTVSVATARWNRQTADVRAALEDGVREPEGFTAALEEPVPAPVRRFLDHALPHSPAPVLSAVLEQEGSFQMGEGDSGWRPFSAVQHIRAYPPAFLWDARIRMAPFVPVLVRDSYILEAGSMKGAIAGAIVVVEGESNLELARGALFRYLAEAPWIPTRLVPGAGLTWSPLDGDRAEATLRDGAVSVSVQFTFDPAGDVTAIFVPSRPQEVDGVTRDLPWVGRFWAHEEVDGYRVPLEGQVAWVVDGVEVPYWRGRLVSVRFTPAP